MAALRWPLLTWEGRSEEARALCEPWLAAASKRLAAEGHKCLANVELLGARGVRIEAEAKRGGFIGNGFSGAGSIGPSIT